MQAINNKMEKEFDTASSLVIIRRVQISFLQQLDLLILSFVSEYEKAAKKLSDLKIDAKLAKVDATIHKDLAEKHKVCYLNFF